MVCFARALFLRIFLLRAFLNSVVFILVFIPVLLTSSSRFHPGFSLMDIKGEANLQIDSFKAHLVSGAIANCISWLM